MRALAVRVLVLLASAIATAAVLAAQQVVVATRDGEIRGVRLNEDTFSVHVMDPSGVVHVVDKITREVRTLSLRGVGFDRLVKAQQEPHNWLMYWGDYQGSHYSSLTQINATNVQRLQAAWTFPMPGDAQLEATPLVIDGVMYTSQPGATVALDARSGRQLWRSVRRQYGPRVRFAAIDSCVTAS